MRQLALLVRHLTDIVEKTGTLSLLRIQSELGSHHSAEISCLTRMLKQVLAIARAVFHLTDDTDKLRMQAVDTEVDSRTLTRLDNLVVELFLHLGNDLLDTCRMDTAVSHELVEGQTADLTTHRVESRDDDGLRRIVDNDLHPACCLERTDVSTLTADDTTLHLIIINMEDAHRVLDSGLRSDTLNGLDDNLLCLHVGIELRLVYHLIDITGGIHLGLVLHALHKAVLGFLGRDTGDFFELGTLLLLHLVEILLLHGHELLLILQTLLFTLHILTDLSEFLLLLVQRELALLELVLSDLHLLVVSLNLLIQFTFLIEETLLHLKEFLFLYNICLFVGSFNHLIIFPLNHITENIVTGHSANDKGNKSGDNNVYHSILTYF